MKKTVELQNGYGKKKTLLKEHAKRLMDYQAKHTADKKKHFKVVRKDGADSGGNKNAAGNKSK